MQTSSHQILADLRSAEDLIHRALTMESDGIPSIRIAYQLAVANAVLSNVFDKIVCKHIEECTRSIIECKNPEERITSFQHLIEIYDSLINKRQVSAMQLRRKHEQTR